ncbi:diphthine synthase [Candidatus Marsarchaeota archaeon]|jgi:diphthine synthase|nr:diphthine synthase [Candidatus Marsarchaeota archaeon]MCL5092329.1 diphthine synthase [Candidatus Marsarchaeota archaeon]
MLNLIGVGLYNGDISVRAVDAAAASDFVFADAYTSFMDSNRIAYLSATLHKKIEVLSRQDMEEESAKLIDLSRKSDVSILFGGDPLIATTHKILFSQAKKAGVDIRIFHSSSVFSAAIGESGLDFYRFGGVCTIPRWYDNYKPVSFYETIARNLRNELHSLVLLDYDQKSNSSISIGEAMHVLDMAEAHYRQGVVNKNKYIFIISDISMESQKVIFTTLEKAATLDFKPNVSTIIIPAKMSDIENEVAGLFKEQ